MLLRSKKDSWFQYPGRSGAAAGGGGGGAGQGEADSSYSQVAYRTGACHHLSLTIMFISKLWASNLRFRDREVMRMYMGFIYRSPRVHQPESALEEWRVWDSKMFNFKKRK